MTKPAAKPRELRRGGPLEIGWREWIQLPELGLGPMKAKIDTGARSAAIHATHIEPFVRDGEEWVRFTVPSDRASHAPRHICVARLEDTRMVKNTGGVAERRYVIHTLLVIGGRQWGIDVTLANRDNMGFRLILGRTSLRRKHVIIHPDRSFLQGRLDAL